MRSTKKSKVPVELADLYQDNPSDKEPFYHGTKTDLKVGDFLTTVGVSNYRSGLQMNHIYFTAIKNEAGLVAELANRSGEPEFMF